MRINTLAVALALVTVPVAGISGYTFPVPVDIVTYAADELYPGSLPGGTAQGDMITARNSHNKYEFIGCGIRAFDDGVGGVYYWGFCQANISADPDTAPEIEAQCFTEDPGILDGIKSVADSSYLIFEWEETAPAVYECTMIGSSTQSFYLEKGKSNK